MMSHSRMAVEERTVDVRLGNFSLEGSLCLPGGGEAIVVFAHGSGSSRHSPRNRFVAQALNARGLGTLLMDLLTPAEEAIDQRSMQYRFDVRLLAERLAGATGWLRDFPDTRLMRVGYFGASTGAAAALMAAAELPEAVGAVVSRGGRPDLAGGALTSVRAPTLLIVGGNDVPVIGLNRQAYDLLPGEKRLDIVPGATHLFEEPGALEDVAQRAGEWFEDHLTARR